MPEVLTGINKYHFPTPPTINFLEVITATSLI